VKITRGMRRRTAKLARRSEIVDRGTLVAGIDIAKKESVVVFIRAADKARVGRLRVPTTAEGVLQVTGRGRQLLAQHGCERLVLAMETTGHYWKILARSAERLGVPYVTVQSFVVARARELDDLTRDKTDQRDAGLIADLASELRFNEVQLETGPWAELRSLANIRDRYRVDQRAALQEQRALLELTWPELLREVPDLDGSHLQAMLRLGLSPVAIAGLTRARFTARLRREHVGRFLPWMAGRLWAAARPRRARGPVAVRDPPAAAGGPAQPCRCGRRGEARRRARGGLRCHGPRLASGPDPRPRRQPAPRPAGSHW